MSNLRKMVEIASMIAAVPDCAGALLPRRAPQEPVPQEIQDEKIAAAKAKRERRAAKRRAREGER